MNLHSTIRKTERLKVSYTIQLKKFLNLNDVNMTKFEREYFMVPCV